MAAIHNIELDLFARTSTGQEISLGKVQVPITIDVTPQPGRPRPEAMRAVEAKRRAMTPKQFDNLDRLGDTRP